MQVLVNKVSADYQKAAMAMSVSHIQRGQKPMKRITDKVREDVPVAT